ncbi:hypothetical protein [Brevundimonas sp.]|uniref:hypothetical protein n=1 Tax=Brevundimonas sp. TaxID=1871086 RepID=UPI002D460ACC|nr:hypothetical protein [Brevundimonas sp.]HYC75176.1 hypothetical protein [Brevundimonas sp.]
MIRLLQFFGLGFFLLMALNGVSWFVDDAGEHRLMEAALPRIQGRDAVTLGGSVGGAVRYPHMCVDGADYYWNAQDLFEVAAIADLILEGPEPPRYWIVVAAPTAQSYDNGAAASERGGRRREFHRLLFRHGRLGMIGGDWRQVLVTALTPALGYDAWGGRLHRLLHQMGLAAAPPPPPGLAARDGLRVDPADAAREAEVSAELQAAHLERIVYYDGSIARRSEQALLGMNRRIRESGGTMILVVPPMTEAMRISTVRELGPEVRAFGGLLKRLAEDGVIVSDHWSDPAFGKRYDLFADNQHLNGAGAEAFSRMLGAELRARGVLPAAACAAGPPAVSTDYPTTSGHEMVDDVR